MLSAILGTLLTILASLISLAYWLGRKFAQVDARFKAIDERFKAVEGGVNALRREFGEKLSPLERKFDEKLSSVERKAGSVAEAARNQLEFFTEFLGYRGSSAREMPLS